jgi:hypothetical protein
MCGKTFVIVSAGLMTATTALHASEDNPKAESKLPEVFVTDTEGNITWQPTAGGLNKYKIVLPRAGVSQAIKYQDTSELFYLSEVLENSFVNSSSPKHWVDLSLTPALSSVKLHWPISDLFSAKMQLNYGDGAKLSYSISGSMITSATPYRYNNVGLSLGDQNELMVNGSILNIGETSEQFYAASISDTHSSRYSASYGQRIWNALGDFNTAWAIGRADGVGFASIQLERDINQSLGFVRLTTKSGTSPQFDLGMQYNLGGEKNSNWRVLVSTNEDGYSALDGPSLGAHRRVNLSNLWRPIVTIDALSSAVPSELVSDQLAIN